MFQFENMPVVTIIVEHNLHLCGNKLSFYFVFKIKTRMCKNISNNVIL